MPAQTWKLSIEKQLLLQRRLKGAAIVGPVEPLIRRRESQGPAPLSAAQHQMWLIDQVNRGNPAYNLPVGFRINGALSADALTAAFNEVIKRHEILRTSFPLVDGQPVQIIQPSLELKLAVVGLEHLPAPLRETSLQKLARAESLRPFDLAKSPLIRVTLFTLSAGEYVLLVNLHHIISDGLSTAILMKEVDLCYRAFSARGVPTLPTLPIQYADFAVWESVEPSRNGRMSQIEFWTKALQNFPLLDLPSDRPRPSRQSFKGSNVWFELPEELCEQLQNMATSEGGTLFMAILAAFQAVLFRYSGNPDIIVGTPISNRLTREVQPLIGNFLNMLALRCDCTGEPSFRKHLQAVKDIALNAFSHRDIPFQQVVEKLNFQRDFSRNPVFQVMLQFLTLNEPSLGDLTIENFDFDSGFAQFDLSLHLYERPRGYKGRFEYCSDLFDRETVERIAGHFLKFLRQAVVDPDRSISSYSLLTEPERVQVLLDWNQTAQEYPRELCVHQLFEEQAARTPGAIAVCFEDKFLTYAQLNAAADRLARHLQTLGVSPEVLVGLYVERSLEMLVGMLGILKAGGAYVPIDPGYPPDRIAFVLKDSCAPVLLTQSRLLTSLPLHDAKVVLLDSAADFSDGRGPAEPPAGVRGKEISGAGDEINEAECVPRSNNLVYTIYTSGSTGRPKGVQVEHRAVVNFIESMRREPGIAAGDVLLALTTISFDIAGLELYLPLVVGAKIVIASRDVATDGAALARELDKHRVTVLQATPATWRLIVSAGWKGSSRLKALCGGEALSPDLAAALLPRCSELWNMYGPTETTIWSTCARVRAADDIPIGKPITNTEIYILNALGQPQPIGVLGELFIGGDGLARGYHNRPELTTERFPPHPAIPGERLFRTGDVACWRKDGSIDCRGRLDRQVKIRGFRIELGEIEAHCAAHPRVKQNVVVVREDSEGDKRLVAYIVPHSPGEFPESGELRDFLRRKLPEYMVPALFVLIDTLPLTPNGKIALKELPPPDSSQNSAGSGYVAPRTTTEKRLVAIWEEALNRRPVGIHDNFFDIGGHSLLAAQIFACVERHFHIRLPLAALFEDPTIEQLANTLSTAADCLGNKRWSPLVPIQPKGSRPPFFCVHGAGGNVLLYRDLARRLGGEQPFYGLQSQGMDGKLTPLTTIEEMAARYVPEVLRIQPSGPYQLGGYCMGGCIAYEMGRLLIEQGQEVHLMALLDTYNTSALKSGLVGTPLLQRLRFHWGNLSRMRLGEIAYYLREKVRIARDGELFNVLDRAFASTSETTGKALSPTNRRSAQLTNDRAAANFKPRPYMGKVTVFRPQVNYDIFTDSDLGWAGVALGGIEVIEIPVNPHAMLVEPFVVHLRDALSKRLLEN